MCSFHTNEFNQLAAVQSKVEVINSANLTLIKSSKLKIDALKHIFQGYNTDLTDESEEFDE